MRRQLLRANLYALHGIDPLLGFVLLATYRRELLQLLRVEVHLQRFPHDFVSYRKS